MAVKSRNRRKKRRLLAAATQPNQALANDLLVESDLEVKTGRRQYDNPLTAKVTGDRESDAQTPGVVREKRAERQFVRINLPMDVAHKGQIFKGRDFSLDGFSFAGAVEGLKPDTESEFELRILFRGYTLTINVVGGLVRFDEQTGFSSYRMVSIGDDQRDIMQRLIRAYLSGQLINFEGFILNNDMQTRRLRESANQTKHEGTFGQWLKLWGRRLTSMAATLAALMIIAILALAVIERLVVNEAHIASITSPRVDVRAPRAGRIAEHQWVNGQSIKRDELILSVDDVALTASIQISRQTIATLGDILPPSANPTSDSFLLPYLEPNKEAEFTSSITEGVHQPLPSPGFGGEFELERTRLAALELIAADNRFHAPCNCEIISIRRPGDWVDRGDTVATFVETRPDLLRIDAQVEEEIAQKLEVGDQALGVLTGWAAPSSIILGEDEWPWLNLTIDAVSIGMQQDKRFGLPSTKAGMATVYMRADRPLPVEAVGRPLQVRFSDMAGLSEILARIERVISDAWSNFQVFLQSQPK